MAAKIENMIDYLRANPNFAELEINLDMSNYRNKRKSTDKSDKTKKKTKKPRRHSSQPTPLAERSQESSQSLFLNASFQ